MATDDGDDDDDDGDDDDADNAGDDGDDDATFFPLEAPLRRRRLEGLVRLFLLLCPPREPLYFLIGIVRFLEGALRPKECRLQGGLCQRRSRRLRGRTEPFSDRRTLIRVSIRQ